MKVSWLAGALLVAGCAVYTSGVRSDGSPRPTRAYLYGRFFMEADLQAGPLFGRSESMGLVIRCQSGDSYTFGSRGDRAVQVLEIKPSRCWLKEVVFADHDGTIQKVHAAPPALQRLLDFSAGRAHYLGDYFATGDTFRESDDLGAPEMYHWDMSPADDRYESTTAEMRRAFPNFASLPTVDARLFPPRPRKLGNGVKMAPGEPPMSPERVAGLAPFIRRSYATPALCEAACAAGQCLPYRTESGPAIACVIRCDKNADCPSGMACNCPNAEQPSGPDCRPIASTPADSMSRVCLSPETAGQP
jgi:hypothetical protein